MGAFVHVELSVPGPVRMPRLCDPVWEDRRKAEIASSFDARRAPIAREGDVFFRPFELLLGPKAVETLGTELTERYGAKPYRPDPCDWRSRHRAPRVCRHAETWLAKDRGQLRLYVLRPNPSTNMVRVVKTLRSRLAGTEDDRAFGVHLNYVMFAEPIYHGGPDPWPPDPSLQPSWPPGPSDPSATPDVAVLDTGVWLGWKTEHPALQQTVRPDPDDIDLLDESTPPDGLDTCAGHGLFICGLIHRLYPELVVDPGRVLNSVGDGDDAMIAAELNQTAATVINMSFGCYTIDDKEPPLLAAAIRNLTGRVVVAAAGNNPNGGSTRPFWPAAMTDVIAVGSWDSTVGEPIQRAFSSNRGPWVNVYARGVDRVSSYVRNGTFNGFAQWSGTSFATPQVAAEIAHRARGEHRPATEVAADMLASNGNPEALQDSPWEETSAVKAKLYDGGDLTG